VQVPYKGELASKSSHYDIVRNTEVTDFLETCEYLKEPTEEEAKAITAAFVEPPPTGGVILPERVIAVDGSPYEANINDRLPSTKVGYVKVGVVLIDMKQFSSLRVMGGRYVDPFRVAELEENNSPLTFVLPSANVRIKGKSSVRDSFRAVVDAQLYSDKTRFNPTDPLTSLRTTLFHLASRRPDEMGTNDPTRLRLSKCPACGRGPIEVCDVPEPQHCPNCGEEVYPSDCLRLWEEVSDFQSNTMVMNRFMLLVEHLMPIHYIRFLAGNSLQSLSEIMFFVDGPLAIFGTAAWLSRAILIYLADINKRLREKHYPDVLMIGLQKTGQVVDYVDMIERFIEPNRLFAIDDDYRYRYVLAGRDPSGNGFGDETYYGQDFVYKTPSGRRFVFALPYPTASKRIPDKQTFITKKTDLTWYTELPRALALIQKVESDLYQNAVVPIALAHRFTAISLMPGGKVLDLLTRRAFEKKG